MGSVEPTSIDCNGCKRDREKRGESPRTLFRMPSEVTFAKIFNRKTLPLFLCQHCDGDDIERIVSRHGSDEDS